MKLYNIFYNLVEKNFIANDTRLTTGTIKNYAFMVLKIIFNAF